MELEILLKIFKWSHIILFCQQLINALQLWSEVTVMTPVFLSVFFQWHSVFLQWGVCLSVFVCVCVSQMGSCWASAMSSKSVWNVDQTENSLVSWRPEAIGQTGNQCRNVSLQWCGVLAAEAVGQNKHGYNMKSDLIFRVFQSFLLSKLSISAVHTVCIWYSEDHSLWKH